MMSFVAVETDTIGAEEMDRRATGAGGRRAGGIITAAEVEGGHRVHRDVGAAGRGTSVELYDAEVAGSDRRTGGAAGVGEVEGDMVTTIGIEIDGGVGGGGLVAEIDGSIRTIGAFEIDATIRMRSQASNDDPFDLIKRDFVACPIVKLCGSWRLVARDSLGLFDGAAVFQKRRDSRRTK